MVKITINFKQFNINKFKVLIHHRQHCLVQVDQAVQIQLVQILINLNLHPKQAPTIKLELIHGLDPEV